MTLTTAVPAAAGLSPIVLRSPVGDLEAAFVPGAGMVGI